MTLQPARLGVLGDAPANQTLLDILPSDWAGRQQVRKAPRRPRSWANPSLLELYSHGNARASSRVLGDPNVAPCSLPGGTGGPGRRGPHAGRDGDRGALQLQLGPGENDAVPAPEAGPTPAFCRFTPTGMRGPACVFWAGLTPCSAQRCPRELRNILTLDITPKVGPGVNAILVCPWVCHLSVSGLPVHRGDAGPLCRADAVPNAQGVERRPRLPRQPLLPGLHRLLDPAGPS
jgi:hypothetical protein